MTVLKNTVSGCVRSVMSNVLTQGSLLNLIARQFSITNVSQSTNNFIVPIIVHRGANTTGDITGRDIFLNGKCKTDFSDLKFMAGDIELEYYLHSYGNYEVLPDSAKIGTVNLIMSDGSILATDTNQTAFASDGIYRSVDNGVNWTKVYNGWAPLAWADSLGNVFATISATSRLIKSASTDISRNTWIEVLDMSAVSGLALHISFTEDDDGNLYFGRYQAANSIAIYKSINRGDSWALVYSQTTQQHVHGMYCDRNVTPNAIYAGLDGSINKIIKSVDAGANWTEIASGTSVAFNQMYAGDGYRLFGGEASIYGGWTIFRTTDDANYTPVLHTRHMLLGMMKLGTSIFAMCGGNTINRYAEILKSDDEGLTWSCVWASPYVVSASASAGLRYVTQPGTPTGEIQEQILLGALDSNYKSSRLYNGGNHYQALFYVKVPILADNTEVKAIAKSTPVGSNIGIFQDIQPSGLLAHWKLNEGSGTAINDVSGNGYTGELTAGAGSWSTDEGKRAGWVYPFINQSGASYNFNASKIIITGSASSVPMQIIKNLTMNAWVKHNNASGAFVILTRWYGLPFCCYGAGLRFYGNAAGNPLRSSLIVDGITCPLLLNNGQWHMVTMILSNDALPVVRFGVDGMIEDAGQALTADPTTVTGDWWIGQRPNEYAMLGQIDDVMLFNRQLTALEIRSIYESRPLLASEPIITV